MARLRETAFAWPGQVFQVGLCQVSRRPRRVGSRNACPRRPGAVRRVCGGRALTVAALFSDNFDTFLHSLQPHGRPQGNLTYPAGLSRQDARIRGNETPRDMLVRCVSNAAGGNVRQCQVEDDLAVFAFIQWRDNNVLSSASVQAIKTNGIDIPTYYAAAGNHQVQYFRFDVERRTGLIFTHPFPHVHYVPRGEVRYSLNGWKCANAWFDSFGHINFRCTILCGWPGQKTSGVSIGGSSAIRVIRTRFRSLWMLFGTRSTRSWSSTK